MFLDSPINHVNYVNARVRDGVRFCLAILNADLDDFLVSVLIDDAGGRGKRMTFPHSMGCKTLQAGLGTRKERCEIRRLLGTARYQGHTDRGVFVQGILPRPARCRLAALLAAQATLEIGFYHEDIDRAVYKQREWFLDEDWVDGDEPCACRFRIQIGTFASEWWMSSRRVEKILMCVREKDREFDKVWKHCDNVGWGLASFPG